MRRRTFIARGALGAAVLGSAGCAARGRMTILPEKVEAVPLEITRPRPAGTMPTGTLGKTDITVSRFGYGAHMSQELLPATKEREYMIREAYDLGVRLFDVYEQNWNTMQFEPMGRYLEPVKDETVVSIVMLLYPQMTLDQTFAEVCRRLRRDHVDMVRLHARRPEDPLFKHWEQLFKWRDEGRIRALGVSAHVPEDLEWVVGNLPIDYAIIPYNFYHNLLWTGATAGDMGGQAVRLREYGIGIVVMKPLGTDWFIRPLIDAAKKLDSGRDLSVPQAALRYVYSSGLNPDSVITAMYSCNHVYEDIAAVYTPRLSADEAALLERLKAKTNVKATAWLPDYYRFLDRWASHRQPEGISVRS